MKGAKNAFEKGDYFKAEELSLAAINEAQDSTDEDELLAITYSNLALTYQNMGKYAQAKIYYYKSLSLHEKLYGKDNSRVATLLNNLASLYFIQNNFSQAKILFERSLAINKKAFGMEHPSVATNFDNLASIYYKQGNPEKAEAFYQRALAIREKSLGPNSPETAVSLMNLATLYRSRGDLERGETLMSRASAILGKTGAQAQPGTVQPPQPESLASKPSLPARKIRTEQSGEGTPEEEKTPVQPPEEPRFFVNPGEIAYHYRWCPFVKGRWENAEQFSSAEQVARAGFQPCRHCRPPQPNGCP